MRAQLPPASLSRRSRACALSSASRVAPPALFTQVISCACAARASCVRVQLLTALLSSLDGPLRDAKQAGQLLAIVGALGAQLCSHASQEGALRRRPKPSPAKP